MGKTTTIDSFFKRKEQPNNPLLNDSQAVEVEPSTTSVEIPKQTSNKRARIEEFNIDAEDCDPSERPQIWEYPVDKRDEIRRKYINRGPCRVPMNEYPVSGSSSHPRKFQESWFVTHPWLEYSKAKDAAFCLPCFLFNRPENPKTFTITGFRNWKKVKNGINDCAFLTHMGEPNSFHDNAVKSVLDLMNQAQHITHVFEKHSSQKIAENRLRLKVSIDSVLYLILQGLPLRGHDEKKQSLNRGNFLQLFKLLGSYLKEEREIRTFPENATYTSGQTQKEIIEIISQKVRQGLREEIGDAKYAIIADETTDEGGKEEMAIVLRFVDKKGILREHFFDIVHVKNTSSLTLKNEIISILSQHGLNIQNIRGQGYDGANNMRGQFNGLQALIANECPYAYYVHYLAHRLQLKLVTASSEVLYMETFLEKLKYIVNSCTSSAKRNDELHDLQTEETTQMTETGELETGSGLNQIGNLQRAGDTRWGSHLKSVTSLITMFNATRKVLDHIIEEGKIPTQRGQAYLALESLNSFEFVLILHFVREIMEITDSLSQALQKKSQDIANALHLVKTTKILIQRLRDNGWAELLSKVRQFCDSHNIKVPDLSGPYKGRRGRFSRNLGDVTLESHYRIDIFYATIDFQLQELNTRFNEQSMNLISFSCAIDPKENCVSFNVEKVCELVTKYYPEDFSELEKEQYLRMELRHYEIEISMNEELKTLSNITELCKWMFETGRSTTYPLIYKLVCLVLTLPVSTTTAERVFSALRIVKSRLRTKMADDFLSDALIAYVEREFVDNISIDSIIDSFRDKRRRRVCF